MNTKLTTLALVFVVAAMAQVASAQYQLPYQGQAPVVYPSFSGYGNYHHASTLEEGWANGQANMMHAAGSANLLHSMAARNYQEARSAALDNRVKSVKTTNEMKKANRENVVAQRGPRPTAETMARIAEERAPERLAASELDMLTGRVSWPAVLEDDAFRTHRERLDELVHKWVRYKGLGPDEYLAVQQSAKAMEIELKKHVKSYSPTDYVKAKKVIESLAYEVMRHEATGSKGGSAASAKLVSARP